MPRLISVIVEFCERQLSKYAESLLALAERPSLKHASSTRSALAGLNS
jgi:hypothetical protein